jgi:hypothetical protein
VNLGGIVSWFKTNRVHDMRDNRVKSLKRISKAYLQDLLCYSILFRIFVDRKKSKEYPHIVEKNQKRGK